MLACQTTKLNNPVRTVTALLAQVIAFVVVAAFIAVVSLSLTLLEWALLQGILAAIASYIMRMPTWWIPIQLCFMPAIAATLAIGLSPVWFGCSFCLLALIYGKTYQTQVPLYLSSTAVTQALNAHLPQQSNFNFIDLGCGCGGLLHSLAKNNPQGSFYGIEAAPLPFFISKIRHRLLRSNCNIRWGDLWKQDLGQYDIVYAYLSPVPMQALWEKAQREMRPGSLFISNTFIVPDVKPDETVTVNDFSHSALYVWRIQHQHKKATCTLPTPQDSDRTSQSVVCLTKNEQNLTQC